MKKKLLHTYYTNLDLDGDHDNAYDFLDKKLGYGNIDGLSSKFAEFYTDNWFACIYKPYNSVDFFVVIDEHNKTFKQELYECDEDAIWDIIRFTTNRFMES